MVQRSVVTSKGTTYWFLNFLLSGVPANPFSHAQVLLTDVLPILVTEASDFTAAHDPTLWETLQEFSQNLSIWTSRCMLLEQTGN